MSDELESRRVAAYAKLEQVVQELSDISDEEADGELEPNVPTAWALVIGFDYVSDDGGSGGYTGIYPRDGQQAGWKTTGILSQALAYLSGK
ncbi:hypothetical protein BJD55_gp129 [Gordonia phage Yvonnetastic]|uniref:Uncharacterized protein n=1 Tax=Gordonia phage Yvonnetastic TaxID=1821566 RepID=A0A142K954_9CAUD|nr:hypothetical protein BJD55_gp129 [Gordonia phage Yvonnetastic]AMS02637.1 hypothetical protein SEA_YVONNETASTIC_93 [Gordonia phage Yvonnetastic]WKW86069.1 hypothetical protein SEA_JONJAMES_95 [Gordonia Phage JonJames]